MKRLVQSGLVAGLVWVPSIVAACPVCFSPSDDANRLAYNLSTLGLTLLPLGLIGGIGFWLWRRTKAAESVAAPATERSV